MISLTKTIKIQTLLVTVSLIVGHLSVRAEAPAHWDNLSSSTVPTVITSKTMALNSARKDFSYEGDVLLVKGDMKMVAERLEGKYNDEQGIDELTAKNKVVITKGINIKARSNKAVYDKKSETMILTENPEVTQDQSVLTADIVRIFLKENRSSAEGNVRVKLIPADESTG